MQFCGDSDTCGRLNSVVLGFVVLSLSPARLAIKREESVSVGKILYMTDHGV